MSVSYTHLDVYKRQDVLTAIGGTDIENFEQYHELLMEEKEGTHLLIKGYRRGAKDQYVAVHFNATVGNK